MWFVATQTKAVTRSAASCRIVRERPLSDGTLANDKFAFYDQQTVVKWLAGSTHMLVFRIRIWFLLGIAVSAPFFLSRLAIGQDERDLKQKIASGLSGHWKITGYEKVGSKKPGPWSGIFNKNYPGYVATCEDVSTTNEESGGKSDGAGNARRHPIFSLWFLQRSASVTPAKIQQDLQKLRFSAMQVATPQLLGFNRDYVVTCTYDCSEKAVTKIAGILKLQPIPE